MLNIYKLLNKTELDTVESIVKEGKESVVLAGLTKEGRWVAVKVYRTLACDYKSMWKYLVLDPRLKGLKKSRWAVVALWARKEFKNLGIASSYGVSCPKPVAFQENVLVMGFIGKDGLPAPRLVDVEDIDWEKAYKKVVKNLEGLAKAGLVHGDLSGYNILFYKKPWLIDFSQSLPLRVPYARELLKRDIANINKFFSAKGVATLEEEKIYNKLVQIFEKRGRRIG